MLQRLRFTKFFATGLIAMAAAFGSYQVHAANGPSFLSNEDELKTFKVPDGYEVTIWAQEPGLTKPTDLDIDSKGRIWATEAVNYRKYMLRPEGDRVVIMEDTKGEGKADSYKVFIQDPGIKAPLGVCVLGDKVYVAQSPKMQIYTIDPSGDKPAGDPVTLFDGFSGVNHDHGLHAGIFGPDGRFWFNGGNATFGDLVKDSKGNPVVDSLGSQIGAKATIFRGAPKEPGKIGYQEGMAFRCNLDGTGFETLGWNFRNNYEIAVDSFGTPFQPDNDDDGNQGVRINYVMEGGDYGYKGTKGSSWGKDMGLYPGQTKQEGHWHQRNPGVVPNLINTMAGSPTGMCVYEGTLLPEKFRGQPLHCDAGPNVVRAYVSTPNGAGYKAEILDLLKSTDKNFRPSDVCVGPDGAVYVSDWHDPVVGGHNFMDREVGKIRGRILRVAPIGFKPGFPKLDLDSVNGQIAALCSPNLATRYLGFSKLEKGGEAAQKALRDLYSTSKDQYFRARALWLLSKFSEGKTDVQTALKDSNVNIRVAALRAARMIKMDMIEIAKQMIADPEIFVARELCLAMNYEKPERSLPILVQLADRYDGKDRWYLEALGIGASACEMELLGAWQKDGKNKGNEEINKNMEWRMKRIIPEPPKKPA